MTNKKQLSIIIVNWNTKQLLKGCLESIVNSEPSNVNYEIIVVDNNSSDNSVELVRNFKVQNSKFKIILIENEKNLGFSRAVNQGIEFSQGKHVLLLNSDTRLEPHTIEKLLAFVNQTQDVGVVGPRLINPDGTIQPSCFNFPTISRAIKEFWLGQENVYSKYYPQAYEPTKVDALVGAVFLITQPALDKVGKFDEKYFLYYEDLDYCQRVWQSGLKVYYHPQIEVVHEHGASGRKISDKTKKWLVESSKNCRKD